MFKGGIIITLHTMFKGGIIITLYTIFKGRISSKRYKMCEEEEETNRRFMQCF
jgi:hypothetical protein